MEQERQRYLVFLLEEPQRFGDRVNYGRMARVALFANLRLLGSVHPVYLNGLEATPNELIDVMAAVTGGRVPFQG